MTKFLSMANLYVVLMIDINKKIVLLAVKSTFMKF